MQPDFFIFFIVILIFSVILHEISHGYAALALGDQTAKLAGRLTLNPLKHIDPIGSIVIPGLLILSGSPFIVGSAKPVPYNPYNLSNQRWGEALVAVAGPLVNVGIAVFFGILIRIGTMLDFVTPAFIQLAILALYMNIVLALFNLIPIPPLDGSKILKVILPYKYSFIYARWEEFAARYWLFVIIAFLFIFFTFLSGIFFAFVLYITALIAGISPSEMVVIINSLF